MIGEWTFFNLNAFCLPYKISKITVIENNNFLCFWFSYLIIVVSSCKNNTRIPFIDQSFVQFQLYAEQSLQIGDVTNMHQV